MLNSICHYILYTWKKKALQIPISTNEDYDDEFF